MSFAKLEISLIGKVSSNALIVYTMMMDRGQYDRAIRAWELRYKIETIAAMCAISVRTCSSCLSELESKGLIVHQRTGRSSYYIINAPSSAAAAEESATRIVDRRVGVQSIV